MMPRRKILGALAGFVLHGAVAGEPDLTGATSEKMRTTLSATGEAWQVWRGGTHSGAWWNTLVDTRVEVPGTTWGTSRTSAFVAQVHWVGNRTEDRTFSETTGAFSPVSNVMANSHARVFNLYYRDSAVDGRWSVKIGQIAIDDDFMTSPFASLFVNAAFGAMPSQVSTPLCTDCGGQGAFPIYSVAAPGVWFEVRPSESWTWQTGVYHGGPGADADDNTGFAWASTAHGGVAAFSELGRHYAIAGKPASTRLGLGAHTGPVDNYEAIQAGRGDTRAHGLFTTYVIQDIALSTDAGGRVRVGGFARVGVSPQRERSAVTFYADAGLNWFGPLVSRPDDVAGLAVAHTRFGSGFSALEGRVRTEHTLEITYRAPVSPRVAVQANAQWLFSARRGPGAAGHGSAAIIGLRTNVRF